MKKGIFITMVLLIGTWSFADEPPKDFMDLKVGFPYGGERGTNYSVKQFTDYGIVPDAKRTWEKNQENEWVLKVDHHDKVKDTDTKMNFMITRVNGLGYIQRIVVNKEEVPQAMFPNILYPMSEAIGQHISLQQKSQPTKNAGFSPPQDLLQLQLHVNQRWLNKKQKEKLGTGSISVGQFFNFLKSHGTATWKHDEEVGILYKTKGAKYTFWIKKEDGAAVIDPYINETDSALEQYLEFYSAAVHSGSDRRVAGEK